MISSIAQAAVAKVKPTPQRTSQTRRISECAPKKKKWRSPDE
jgi:hypothetical protein